MIVSYRKLERRETCNIAQKQVTNPLESNFSKKDPTQNIQKIIPQNDQQVPLLSQINSFHYNQAAESGFKSKSTINPHSVSPLLLHRDG